MTGLVNADVLQWAASYDGPKFHALLCDPPYELGFMGKDWDKSGIAFKPETWAALATHLHPGAFGMAFASARGWHRLAVAIEDAGLRIHPSIFIWSFATGFPKATRVKDAPEFDGHRYGLQVLKPAAEVLILFQKPYEGRPVDCITETGAGALWIDGGRIDSGGEIITTGGVPRQDYAGQNPRPWHDNPPDAIPNPRTGRWPANLILQHTLECGTDCVPECPVRRLGEQSGERPGCSLTSLNTGSGIGTRHGIYQKGVGGKVVSVYGDSGTASRFFYQADWMAERLDEADPVRYCAKAGRKEKDAGLEGVASKHVRQMSGGEFAHNSGSINSSKNGATVRNPHPTVKPIALARYLATLLLPPDLYAPRRLMVPFAGVASEMIGANQAGWEEVIGIEMDLEYCEIGEARLTHWLAKPVQVKMRLDKV